MKTKEEQLRESPADVQEVALINSVGILICQAALTLWAMNFYPQCLWSQVAMVGFWLALGKGNIWWRLLWFTVGMFVLGLLDPGILTRNYASGLLFTVAFAGLFAGIGVIALGQNAGWTKLRIQFRFWELIVGTAILGVAFLIVKNGGDFDGIPRYQWKTIYYVLIHSSLMGLGTATVGLSLLARPGLPTVVVLGVAALVTVLIPCIDYLACESLEIELFDAGLRLNFYVSNMAVVWMTVLLYRHAVRSGDPMIFETNCDERESDGPLDAS
ncbi:hypothetical protein AB1K70_22860 [Bremerella sp. JC770]|uniref:hypothetical protein n=1 Tax=Bremerella sp. JC770 TaxID=3232137 RepID=UPI003458A18C